MQNILTFDVEDWYQGLEIPHACWADLENRLSVGLDFILGTLAEYAARATFFVLGQAAVEHSASVRRLVSARHEIGTHGWSHTPAYRQTRAQFREELRRSLDVLQSLSGQPVLGHRAAFFSITARSLWVLEELAGVGMRYDSSIFPVHNYRYGMPRANRFPHKLPELPVWEFPLSTLSFGNINLPFSGGFYARLWPYAWIRWAIRHLNEKGQPAIVYFHPWEFDLQHPRLQTGTRWLARVTHYHGLERAPQILRALLRDFRWTTLGDYMALGCYHRMM
jgi:polysaccharide deacetylase family protein (PEP-CTERM system associated)